jgi:hypothetical protein
MSSRLEFDVDKRIVQLLFFGIVTEESLLRALQEGFAFIKANGMEGSIMDFSEIEDFQISLAFFRRFADNRELIAPDKPRVVIAPQPFVFGVFRAFQLYTDKSGVHPVPFRSREEAYAHLKLVSPVFGSQPWGPPG